jgi:hypothetical protein
MTQQIGISPFPCSLLLNLYNNNNMLVRERVGVPECSRVPVALVKSIRYDSMCFGLPGIPGLRKGNSGNGGERQVFPLSERLFAMV